MNDFLCAFGHKWSSDNPSLSEECPWCRADRLTGEVERLKGFLRELESSAKAALDGYRMISEDEDDQPKKSLPFMAGRFGP